MPFEDVTFLGAGVNHQAFILRFERDGEDLYPRLAARVADDPELRRRVRVALYQRLGYFPTESSEHGAEYVPWFLRDDGLVDRHRLLVGDYIQRSEENLEEYEHIKRRRPGAGAARRAGPAAGADVVRVRNALDPRNRWRRFTSHVRRGGRARAIVESMNTTPRTTNPARGSRERRAGRLA
ncbi:MAG: glycoside hydrolase family 4 [Conexibacter sp.]|nr:glycoside hydrolase family 4 [Conexibacter sp.]